MYYYSATENTFCPAELKQAYIDAGSFPEDMIEVSDDVWLECAGNPPPDGKERAVGETGLPVWADIFLRPQLNSVWMRRRGGKPR